LRNKLKTRKLLTIEGIHHLKAYVNRLHIKRQNGGHGLVELESKYNPAIVGLNEYIKQDKDRLTGLVQEYVWRGLTYCCIIKKIRLTYRLM